MRETIAKHMGSYSLVSQTTVLYKHCAVPQVVEETTFRRSKSQFISRIPVEEMSGEKSACDVVVEIMLQGECKKLKY